MSVEFLPAALTNCSTAKGSIKINVIKITPIILWPDPDDIIEGTALNVGIQLNARAGLFIWHHQVFDFKNLPGKLDYTLYNITPVVSGVTIPSAGLHTLSIDFTPDIIILITTKQQQKVFLLVRP